MTKIKIAKTNQEVYASHIYYQLVNIRPGPIQYYMFIFSLISNYHNLGNILKGTDIRRTNKYIIGK